MIRNDNDIILVLRHIGGPLAHKDWGYKYPHMYTGYNTETGKNLMIVTEGILPADTNCVELGAHVKGDTYAVSRIVGKGELTNDEQTYIAGLQNRYMRQHNEVLDVFGHNGLLGLARAWLRLAFHRSSDPSPRERHAFRPMPQRAALPPFSPRPD